MRRTKNSDLSTVFFSPGSGGSPTWPDPENRVGDQDIGSPGRPVSSGLQVSGESEHSHATTRPPLGDLPAAFFLQNILQLHQQRRVMLHVDSWALWKIINEEDSALIPKKSRRELFQRIVALGIFGAG